MRSHAHVRLWVYGWKPATRKVVVEVVHRRNTGGQEPTKLRATPRAAYQAKKIVIPAPQGHVVAWGYGGLPWDRRPGDMPDMWQAGNPRFLYVCQALQQFWGVGCALTVNVLAKSLSISFAFR